MARIKMKIIIIVMVMVLVPIGLGMAAFNPIEGDAEKRAEEIDRMQEYEDRLGIIDTQPLALPGEDGLTLGAQAQSEVEADRAALIAKRRAKQAKALEEKKQKVLLLEAQNKRLEKKRALREKRKEVAQRGLPIIVQLVIVIAAVWAAMTFRRKKE